MNKLLWTQVILLITAFPMSVLAQNQSNKKEANGGFKERFFMNFSLGFGNGYVTSFDGNSFPSDQNEIGGDFSSTNGFTNAELGFGYGLNPSNILITNFEAGNYNFNFRFDGEQYAYRGGRGKATLGIQTFFTEEGPIRPFTSLSAYYAFGTSDLLNLSQNEVMDESLQAIGADIRLGFRYQNDATAYSLYFAGSGDILGERLKVMSYSINASYHIYVFNLFGD